jgi:site-specific recombinase XerD
MSCDVGHLCVATVERSKRPRSTRTASTICHTFGTAMAATGVPIRTLQEWVGHRDIGTTQRYADYAPNDREVEMVDRAFGRPHP